MALSLSEFIATGKPCLDLGTIFHGCDLEGIPGRVYADDGAYIIGAGDLWYLPLGNQEHSGKLADLEPILHAWAVSEELI